MECASKLKLPKSLKSLPLSSVGRISRRWKGMKLTINASPGTQLYLSRSERRTGKLMLLSMMLPIHSTSGAEDEHSQRWGRKVPSNVRSKETEMLKDFPSYNYQLQWAYECAPNLLNNCLIAYTCSSNKRKN